MANICDPSTPIAKMAGKDQQVCSTKNDRLKRDSTTRERDRNLSSVLHTYWVACIPPHTCTHAHPPHASAHMSMHFFSVLVGEHHEMHDCHQTWWRAPSSSAVRWLHSGLWWWPSKVIGHAFICSTIFRQIDHHMASHFHVLIKGEQEREGWNHLSLIFWSLRLSMTHSTSRANVIAYNLSISHVSVTVTMWLIPFYNTQS